MGNFILNFLGWNTQQDHLWKEVRRETLGSTIDFGSNPLDITHLYRIAVNEECMITGETRIREVLSLFPEEDLDLKRSPYYSAVRNAFEKAKSRKWDKIYWAIDFHETIFKGYYDSNQEVELFDECVEVLKWLTASPNHVLIAYTCSYAKDFINVNKRLFEKYKICFNYLNENPECGNTNYADFNKKFYFNILLDDKAGLTLKDWPAIQLALEESVE